MKKTLQEGKSDLVTEFQVKGEDGSLEFFDSFEKAYQYILQYDPQEISKLSWSEHITKGNDVTEGDIKMGVVVWDKSDRTGISADSGEHFIRFRPKTKKDQWSPESEKAISSMCLEYRECKDNNAVFWVHQMIGDFDLLETERKKYNTEKEWDEFYLPKLIVEVKTTKEFEEEYVKNTKRRFVFYQKEENYSLLTTTTTNDGGW
jgi:hypothetical protein